MVAAAGLATVVALGLGVTSAGAVSVKPTTPPEFYLSLGASVSVGVQPVQAYPKGRPTTHGFANDLVILEARRGKTLELTKLGCPGETAYEMINGGDHCYHVGTTQLSDALAFLRAHHGQRGIVTLDVGFNDVRPCLLDSGLDTTCLSAATSSTQSQVEQIVTALKAAAGPEVTFIGVNLYNPYLAADLTGTYSANFVAASVTAISQMNDALADAYAATSTRVANVAGAFSIDATKRVRAPGLGTVPKNVKQVCTLTWMCHHWPYGPNIHPDDHGYWLIARAVDVALNG
jgi:lysophospholipase L1-like esterase